VGVVEGIKEIGSGMDENWNAVWEAEEWKYPGENPKLWAPDGWRAMNHERHRDRRESRTSLEIGNTDGGNAWKYR